MREAALYKKLVERYIEKKLSSEELEVFYHLLDEGKLDNYILDAMDEDIAVIPEKPKVQLHRFSLSKVIKISAAACILVAVGVAFFIRQTKVSHESFVQIEDKAPGAQKATLVLGSGETIDLNNAPDGQIRTSENVSIVKDQDGRISYKGKRDPSGGTDAFNMIKVPKGGHYEISLADGTRVFLNAFSTLTFPSVFTGKERLVKLTGEAYFEVTPSFKAGGKAFVVETGNQKVQVVGTSFNINAYTDEPYTKTTLLKGKVNVLTSAGTTKLVPGQQSSMDFKGVTTVANVDPETALDWKNGDFIFVNESLRSVMRKLSRWYDMDVVYEKGISDETLSGQISRNKTLSQVLQLLSLSGDFNYKLDHNLLHLYPNTKAVK
ncbi:FecR family protein [Pedobacter nutrimenti]|uniref:FecR family protein n=1 Tax=Pedobacter nutrimenti TaxID=1241337 RepID=UPI00292FD118|nr:FecR domain-containing protein [Pedobacter nutrimenti]